MRPLLPNSTRMGPICCPGTRLRIASSRRPARSSAASSRHVGSPTSKAATWTTSFATCRKSSACSSGRDRISEKAAAKSLTPSPPFSLRASAIALKRQKKRARIGSAIATAVASSAASFAARAAATAAFARPRRCAQPKRARERAEAALLEQQRGGAAAAARLAEDQAERRAEDEAERADRRRRRRRHLLVGVLQHGRQRGGGRGAALRVRANLVEAERERAFLEARSGDIVSAMPNFDTVSDTW